MPLGMKASAIAIGLLVSGYVFAAPGVRYSFNGDVVFVSDPESSIPAALSSTISVGDRVAAVATVFDSDVSYMSSDSPGSATTNYFLPDGSGTSSAIISTTSGVLAISADGGPAVTIMNDGPAVGGGDVWAYGFHVGSSPDLFMQVVYGDPSLSRLSDQSYFIESSASGWPDNAWALYDFNGPSSVRLIALARGSLTTTVLTPEVLVQELTEVVLGYNLNSGIENAFDAKLQNALLASDRVRAGERGAALSILYAFLDSVEAQRGKALTDLQADELLLLSEDVIRTLENQ